MIDQDRCMAPRDRTTLLGTLFGKLCQEPATHMSIMGRRCRKHAEEMRSALADPATVGNVIAGRARTAEEIAAMVVELQSEARMKPKGSSE